MERLRGFRRRFRFPWRTRRQIRRDVDDELAFHLVEKTEALQQEGLSLVEAREEALRQFGDIAIAREALISEDRRGERYSAWRRMVDDVGRDTRHAFRSLSRTPGFTAVAVMVLGVGIGVLSTMFSLVNLIAFQPALVEDPPALRSVYSRTIETAGGWRNFSLAEYEALRDGNRVFTDLAAYDISTVGLGSGDIARRAMIAFVSANYFQTLGVEPALGRAFTEAEVLGEDPPTVVLSHELWTREGADPDVLGSFFEVNGQQLVVVGVGAEGFTGPVPGLSPGIWVPLAFMEQSGLDRGRTVRLSDPDARHLMLFGRMREGVTAEEVDRDLAALAASSEANAPAPDGEPHTYMATRVARMSIGNAPDDESFLIAPMALLIGMGSVVLLIACMNLANMFLARGATKRTEMAIRQSLGSGRARLIRQLLTEGMLLSIMGGAVGLLFAYTVTPWIAASATTIVPFEAMLVFDTRPALPVFIATALACIVATVLFGLGPAWRVTGRHLAGGLKTSAGEDAFYGARPKHKFFAPRNLMIVAQLALSLVMLTAGGLFLRGAMIATATTPGFSTESSLLVELDPSLAGYDERRIREVYREVLNRLRQLPQVESAAITSAVPFSGTTNRTGIQAAGALGGEEIAVAHRAQIGDDYFEALRLPLLRGREFTPSEAAFDTRVPVAIIDEPLAEELFPGVDPLGRYVRFPSRDPNAEIELIEIVGIAQGVRQRLSERSPSPHVYLPNGWQFLPNLHIHLRIEDRVEDAQALLQTVRNEIRAVDPALPVLRLITLADFVDENVELWVIRFAGTLFTWLGVAALFVAVVGVYGVTAFLISRRTREIGLRMALGATRERLTRQILTEYVHVTGYGLFLGLLLAAVVGRVLSSVLYGVSAGDPLVFFFSTTLLASTAIIAAYLPVRRASRVAPTEALRYD